MPGSSASRFRPPDFRFEDSSLNNLQARVTPRQWRGMLIGDHILRRDGGDQGCGRNHEIPPREIGLQRHLLSPWPEFVWLNCSKR